ncbi:jg26961 [Pararge aegeria aegeria]|uniref:Jg26961 protein n=1 Tax=Pararge aegeria aegeria TaxID=348720 RepID=A0A8S4RWY1_9NEOP|nr:jg26961 [Pararge aegeria aegeria]
MSVLERQLPERSGDEKSSVPQLLSDDHDRSDKSEPTEKKKVWWEDLEFRCNVRSKPIRGRSKVHVFCRLERLLFDVINPSSWDSSNAANSRSSF